MSGSETLDPEMRTDGLREFEDDADDADVVDGVVTVLPILREIGDHRGRREGLAWCRGQRRRDSGRLRSGLR